MAQSNDDEKASGKIRFIDYVEITLEEWLKDNNYSFLSGALSSELGVKSMADIKMIVDSDIDRMFKNMTEAARKLYGLSQMYDKASGQVSDQESKNIDILTSMDQASRSKFKQKFLQFKNGYLNHLGGKSYNQSHAANNHNNDELPPAYPNATPLELLAQNYETTVEFIKQFKNDTTTLASQHSACQEQIAMEYNTLVKGIADYRDSMLAKMENNYYERSQLLESQLKLLENHLKSNQACEEECGILVSTSFEISDKCKGAIKKSPRVYNIPFNIKLEESNLKNKQRDYGFLFSKLETSDVNIKRLDKLKWNSNEGGGDNTWRNEIKRDSKVDAFDKDTKKWYVATILSRVNAAIGGKDRVEVRFDGFSSKFDIWMDVISANLSKYNSHTENSVKANLTHRLASPRIKSKQSFEMSDDAMDDDLW